MGMILNKALGLTLGLAVLAACSPARTTNQAVTTLYPTEFLVARVADGTPPVRNLAAAGVEPHDLELSAQQVDAILDAQVVFALVPGFQPAVDEAAKQREKETIELVDALPGAVPAEARLDPHVWLDPLLMRDMTRAVGGALAVENRDRADVYRTRAAALEGELEQLDREYQAGLASCQRRTFFVTHDAFGWLAKRYNLTQVSVVGNDPEAEPSAARIAELAVEAKRSGATTMFAEELLPPDIAETVAREAGGLQVRTLSPIESLTPEQAKAGDDYFSLMRANLAALRTALGCS